MACLYGCPSNPRQNPTPAVLTVTLAALLTCVEEGLRDADAVGDAAREGYATGSYHAHAITLVLLDTKPLPINQSWPDYVTGGCPGNIFHCSVTSPPFTCGTLTIPRFLDTLRPIQTSTALEAL